jgi:DNA repair exonuclease SbcCD nuclease subunit
MNLFKKVAYFSDAHFGRRANSPVDLMDNINFIQWFIDEAKSRGCRHMIFGGDWHDHRNNLQVTTLHASLESLQLLNDAFEHCWFIPGNHDLFYRTSRDVSSIEFARNFENITIVREPTTLGDVTFLPWLVGDEAKTLKIPKSRYVFAHLEIPGFLMNAMVEMPDSDHAMKADRLKDHELVFTGHFHMRQSKGNVIYTGNVMPFNFGDAWDEDRGAMFLDWGGEPDFVAWPDQPLYRTMKLSELLDNPDKFLVRNLSARVTVDGDISYEEAQVIKEEFIAGYGLRKLELVHQHKTELQQEFSTEVAFQSIDQIVIDGLNSVTGTGLKPDRLIEIYRSLTE